MSRTTESRIELFTAEPVHRPDGPTAVATRLLTRLAHTPRRALFVTLNDAVNRNSVIAELSTQCRTMDRQLRLDGVRISTPQTFTFWAVPRDGDGTEPAPAEAPAPTNAMQEARTANESRSATMTRWWQKIPAARRAALTAPARRAAAAKRGR